MTMIGCNEYDYIEIACMHQYPVKIVMKAGGFVQGKALDVKINQSRKECIKISNDGKETLVELDTISKLEVLVENPHFEEIEFN